MPKLTAFHPTQFPEPNESITLTPEESHHLTSVLRIKPNTPVTLFNPLHQSVQATITHPHKKNTEATITSEVINIPPPLLSLAIALPKGNTLDSILRHITPIGIHNIHPLTSEHSEVHLDPQRASKKIQRWSTIAIEACKQSKNLFTPNIFPVQPIDDFLNSPPATINLIASLQPNAAPAHTHIQKNTPTTFLIGPEGDFSSSEYALAQQADFKPTSLAHHILRTATATIYALAVADQLLIP